jgi:hypothetical protein
MYPSAVGKRLGIVGDTLRYEVDMLCQLKHEKQRSEIEANLQSLDDLQVKNLQQMLDNVRNQVRR